MTKLFVQILQMSISASYVIIAILLARLILKKAPKKYSYALWSVAAFRLLCPYSFGSVFSLFNLHLGEKEKPAIDLTGVTVVPGTETIIVDTGIPAVSQTIQQVTNAAPAAPASETIGETIVSATQEIIPVQQAISPLQIVAWIWLTGVIALLTYGIISYVSLKRKMRMSMPLRDNIRQAYIRTPFILGFLKPTIYIPFDLEPVVENISISHERCHIRRGDPIVKLFSYLILILHWFNPLCWLAYLEMEKDMEMSVDEYVLANYRDVSTSYISALLSFSTGHRFSLASPLAFGENNVKERILNVMRYKKTSRIISALAIIICVVALVACGTNSVLPESETEPVIVQPQSETELIGPEQDTPFRFVSPPIIEEHLSISRGFCDEHPGFSFWSIPGEDILAVADGVVEASGYYDEEKGNIVVLSHKDGYKTIYAHCKEVRVSKGQEIQAGQVIAEIGNSNNYVAGYNLYFELQNREEKPVDPMSYLAEVSPRVAQGKSTYNTAEEQDVQFEFENAPVEGDWIIVRSYDEETHHGIDIMAKYGSPIYAVLSGKASTYYSDSGYGNCVLIEHENGYYTLYAHCESIIATEGEIVQAGQQIATVGGSGYATGYHLHFELRDPKGNQIDPLKLIVEFQS